MNHKKNRLITEFLSASEDADKKMRLGKMARSSYAITPSEDAPSVLIPDTEVTRCVEDALDHLDTGHTCRRIAGRLFLHSGFTMVLLLYHNTDMPLRFIQSLKLKHLYLIHRKE